MEKYIKNNSKLKQLFIKNNSKGITLISLAISRKCVRYEERA